MAEFGKLDVYGDLDVKNNDIKQVNKINDKAVTDLETEAGAQSKVNSHANLTNNPHSVTKSQVGLSNVDNAKQATKSEFDTHVGATNPHSITKSTVGLGNVENKSSATIRGEITSGNVTGALGFTPEPTFTKNTAFNKNFGAATGTVAQGDDVRFHTHSNKSILDSTTASYTTTEETKLAGIAANANNYSHPTSAGNKHIPSGGAANQFLKYSGVSGTAAWSAVSFSELVNVPSEFTPEAHNHDDRYYTKTQSDGRYAPISHNHNASDINAGTLYLSGGMGSAIIEGNNTFQNTANLAGVKGSGGAAVGAGYLGAMISGRKAGVIGIAGTDNLSAYFDKNVEVGGVLTVNGYGTLTTENVETSSYASTYDTTSGAYKVVDHKRADGTLRMKSTLSAPNVDGNFETLTVQYYNAAGTTVTETKTWTLSYDEGRLVSKVLL